MTELLTSAQMRAIEQAAIAAGAVTGRELMERAGQGVVAAIFAEWPELGASRGGAAPAPPGYLPTESEGARRAVVLCGPGNNGGDGFVVARLLRAFGWAVKVVALGPTLTPDAAAMRARWAAMGPVGTTAAFDWRDLDGGPLVVDAMFGTGLARAIAPGVWGLLEMAVARGCRIVAVDILSGLCADSGRVRADGGFIERAADLTVTFERAKLGHVLDEGARLSGRLRVVPIGLAAQMDAMLRADGDAVVEETRPDDAQVKPQGHKYAHGHALVLAGAPGHGGAGRLAARGGFCCRRRLC